MSDDQERWNRATDALEAFMTYCRRVNVDIRDQPTRLSIWMQDQGFTPPPRPEEPPFVDPYNHRQPTCGWSWVAAQSGRKLRHDCVYEPGHEGLHACGAQAVDGSACPAIAQSPWKPVYPEGWEG